jgi:hypothetical protein
MLPNALDPPFFLGRDVGRDKLGCLRDNLRNHGDTTFYNLFVLCLELFAYIKLVSRI